MEERLKRIEQENAALCANNQAYKAGCSPPSALVVPKQKRPRQRYSPAVQPPQRGTVVGRYRLTRTT